jgi:hypothetical protein
VKVIVSKTKRTRTAGGRADDRLKFVLDWMDGGTEIWPWGKVKVATVASALDRRLDTLDVEVRAGATIKAVARVWARSGGIRRKTVADWKYGDREALSSFVSRAFREADKLPHRARTFAWMRGSMRRTCRLGGGCFAPSLLSHPSQLSPVFVRRRPPTGPERLTWQRIGR